jgi:DNA topoisomerase-3
VFETDTSYLCEVAAKRDKRRKCDFRSGRVILSQEIPREQMAKLLAEGKTDLFTGFVSTRTKRPFQGFLVLERKKDDVKVGFEFPPREPKSPKSAAAKMSAAKASAKK